MCLLALAWKAHPQYPLIFAGNRDEFHARPALAAHWWHDAPDVFGGRDLEANGSWLGVRRDGRFAVVTNFREPDRRPENLRSRGELPTQFLCGDTAPADYLRYLHDNRDEYAGFNLLFGDPLQQQDDNQGMMFYFSNRDDVGTELPPGIHALSNHLLNTPWPKVQRLRAAFEQEMQRAEPRADALLEMLADPQPAPHELLPDTGVDARWEHALSAAKVVTPSYGTRASTVVMVDCHGDIFFRERRFAPSGDTNGETLRRFGPAPASGNMS